MGEYLENMFIEVDTKLFLEREEESFKKGQKECIGIEIAEILIEKNYPKKEILRISQISEEELNRLQSS